MLGVTPITKFIEAQREQNRKNDKLKKDKEACDDFFDLTKPSFTLTDIYVDGAYTKPVNVWEFYNNDICNTDIAAIYIDNIVARDSTTIPGEVIYYNKFAEIDEHNSFSMTAHNEALEEITVVGMLNMNYDQFTVYVLDKDANKLPGYRINISVYTTDHELAKRNMIPNQIPIQCCCVQYRKPIEISATDISGTLQDIANVM